MFNGLPFNNYQYRQMKTALSILAVLFLTVLISGNIIQTLISKHVSVPENSYILKNSFPIFTSEKEYIAFIKQYPHDPGVKLTTHIMRRGESFWNLTRRNNISIETFIAANPHVTSLSPTHNIEVVIPSEDGVLFAFDSILDIPKMADLLKFDGMIKGDYKRSFFSLISMDDIRLVFFPKVKPVIVNNSLERLYQYKRIFNCPLRGYFTSLFGERVDPFFHGTAFHNGIDIHAKRGTPVKAARDGMVAFSGWKQGYGKTVVIQHHDGYSSLYGHFREINVETGTWVSKNEIIGLVGSTGRSTGPHLHFEIRRHDRAINPLVFIW